MVSSEEETYSTIFTSLKHPVRRKILRMLTEKPRNFSEILDALGISSSHLTYHLESLGELVSKTDDGKYKLSAFGEAAVITMSKVEEAQKVTELKRLPSLHVKWKSIFAVLMIGTVVLAGLSYVQYQSLNRLSAENEQLHVEYERLKELVELVEQGASMRSEYTLRYRSEKIDSGFIGGGRLYCVLYSPYENSTLYLVLSVIPALTESHLPISVQEGNAFLLGTNETATVIWSANATAGWIYRIPLPAKGWYTISLAGPIRYTDKHMLPIPFLLIEDVNGWMTIRIIYEGKYSSFFIMEN